MATAKTRDKILNSFLSLLAERGYEEVSLPLLAETAKVKLSDLRGAFASRTDLVAAFLQRVDTEVLDGRDGDMDDQPARDRLFDILMSRIDALSAHREAVRALREAARRDPGLALRLNRLDVRSQKWMLIAAGIEMSGVKAAVAAEGLSVAFARVVDVWLDEDDAGMPRTMARLDRELDRGTGLMKRLDDVDRLAGKLGAFLRKASERRAPKADRAGEPDAEATA